MMYCNCIMMYHVIMSCFSCSMLAKHCAESSCHKVCRLPNQQGCTCSAWWCLSKVCSPSQPLGGPMGILSTLTYTYQHYVGMTCLNLNQNNMCEHWVFATFATFFCSTDVLTRHVIFVITSLIMQSVAFIFSGFVFAELFYILMSVYNMIVPKDHAHTMKFSFC